ncbi:hypothetical protein [Streptomyces sp. MNP-20]|uniref:hypothetical protein n=1 Tax=Streptomyces sp. MNP-20 TaxID=2721165 RepID=UPI001554F924|nr:hypothetical protein [Streptomyces sp. MNP-20]
MGPSAGYRSGRSRLGTAIVDRLTFNGALTQSSTDFYRLAHTKTQADQAEAS